MRATLWPLISSKEMCIRDRDLDVRSSLAQQELVKKYYTGSIPHVTVLDRNGKAVYDDAGEVDEAKISQILDAALK